MRILVGVKRVVDYAVKVRVNPDKVSGVDLSNVKMSLNPFCEIALEEAVRLKESKAASEVVAVSIGPKQCSETIRTALAVGADRGIHILTDLRTDYMQLQPLAVAQLLQKTAEQEKSDLILVGKQGIDSDCGQVGPMLAGLMKCPQATYAAKIEYCPNNDDNTTTLKVDCETDSGTETIEIRSLPAVISCDLRLNTPRYATLPNIMKAKKKKVDTIPIEDMGIANLEPLTQVLEVYDPPPRKEGVMVESVDDLLDKLRNEANVIA